MRSAARGEKRCITRITKLSSSLLSFFRTPLSSSSGMSDLSESSAFTAVSQPVLAETTTAEAEMTVSTPVTHVLDPLAHM